MARGRGSRSGAASPLAHERTRRAAVERLPHQPSGASRQPLGRFMPAASLVSNVARTLGSAFNLQSAALFPLCVAPPARVVSSSLRDVGRGHAPPRASALRVHVRHAVRCANAPHFCSAPPAAVARGCGTLQLVAAHDVIDAPRADAGATVAPPVCRVAPVASHPPGRRRSYQASKCGIFRSTQCRARHAAYARVAEIRTGRDARVPAKWPRFRCATEHAARVAPRHCRKRRSGVQRREPEWILARFFEPPET